MADNKKILLSLPEDLLESLGEMAKTNGVSRTDFIRTLLQEYVLTEREKLLREQLKQGYTEMGKINLDLAEMCFDADAEAWQTSEENLSESE